MGGFAIAATIMLWLAYLRRTVIADLFDSGFRSTSFIAQTLAYVLVMTLLTFSALMYLAARQGAMYRSRKHVRVPRAEIDAHFDHERRTMTVLIPSYREDPEIVRAAIMAAALQEFPHLRIVLLIDDPPFPTDPDAVAGLEGCRALPRQVQEWLRVPRERFEASMVLHEQAAMSGGAGRDEDLRTLADDYRWAAQWLAREADEYRRNDHVDDFVAHQVLGGLASDFDAVGKALFAALDEGAAVPAERMAQMARRLVWTFSAELTSFERKTYAHLPHDANKAMNLNAYIGLMGHSYSVLDTRLGMVLREDDECPDLVIPDSDYLLTLDADSVLLREYCLRLVHHLELPGNERIAVIQTPYSAFRGAPTRLERIAGATTDIQYVVHQGLTYFNATFWVGANAVIRKVALDDIEEVTQVDGYPVRRYVQDRTVIEDTESSIDLVAHGWSLYNYPERLSYSATPPDFGSLVVQRARWANGGLLIMPKFWHYIRAQRKQGHRVPWTQAFLRFNYMASIAWSSVALIFLLAFPFNSALLSPIILSAALPYFLAMAYDLHRLGYKRTDVFRIYGFNLILVPVNLAGTFKSLQQAAAKSKIAFARTPKVENRTAAPALFVVAAYLIAGFALYTLLSDVPRGAWVNGIFAAVNFVLATYAIVAFMGLRNSVVDIVVGMANWVRVPVTVGETTARPEGDSPLPPTAHDWETVLYYGPSDGSARSQGGSLVATAPLPRRGERRSRHRADAAS